jgi:hypothetical protein
MLVTVKIVDLECVVDDAFLYIANEKRNACLFCRHRTHWQHIKARLLGRQLRKGRLLKEVCCRCYSARFEHVCFERFKILVLLNQVCWDMDIPIAFSACGENKL